MVGIVRIAGIVGIVGIVGIYIYIVGIVSIGVLHVRRGYAAYAVGKGNPRATPSEPHLLPSKRR